jgi:micrococcal nuclease
MGKTKIIDNEKKIRNCLVYLLVFFIIGCAYYTNSPFVASANPSKSQDGTSTPSIPSQYLCVPHDNPREIAFVEKIIDGDSILVRLNDHLYEVRYIGINTPEFDSPQEKAAQYAADVNRDLVLGKVIWMVKDVRERDKYQRLLRFVFVGDTFVNYELVRLGVAEVIDYSPDLSCQKLFKTIIQNKSPN